MQGKVLVILTGSSIGTLEIKPGRDFTICLVNRVAYLMQVDFRNDVK
jgi:hypothetical protein